MPARTARIEEAWERCVRRVVSDGESGSEAVASFPSPDVRFTDQRRSDRPFLCCSSKAFGRLQWNSW